MSCSEIFSVLVRGRFHTVAPKAVIESRDSDALHRLFPNCRIALPDGKTDFLATEDKADPLYERNETDHLDFLPQGPFQVFGVKVGKTKEQILIATGYAQPNGVDGNFTYAYLLEPRHPCKPTFIATAGYPSRSDGERQELHVILMRGKPYILSLTDFTPGGSALFIRLTEIPRYGVSRRHWKYASMSTN